MKFYIVDSREKPKAIKSILQSFTDAGAEYIISKLPFGDYMDWKNLATVVARNQTIAELAKN
jgi:ERCC4-type nuclease